MTGECRPFPRAENDDCKEGSTAAFAHEDEFQSTN